MILSPPPTQFDPLTAIVIEEKQPEPKQKLYIIRQGDTLSEVAKDNDTTVRRLYDKNKSIKNPDVITVGQKLVIPAKGEKLKHRRLPTQNTPRTPQNRSGASHARSSSGNTFYWGNCTWFVKNQRPEVPNSWSDAWNWYGRAQADGWATGATPRVGAIAWARSYGHVAIVIGVGNGTTTVREMNAKGLGVISERTTPSSEWLYIY